MKTNGGYFASLVGSLLPIAWIFLVASFAFVLSSCPTGKPETPERCGTMIGYKERIQTDIDFAQNQAKLEQTISAYIKKMRTGEFTEFRSGNVVIPVVVHVVYENSAENVSDAQIQSQIDILNRDYRRLNTDVSGVPGEFSPLVADARIEFKLARRDPDCNPTNGITRTSTTVTSFSFDPLAATATTRNPVKFASTGGVNGWPSDEYLNLWVCDLEEPLLGYGSFPADLAARPTEDGVVIDYESFGDTGTAAAPFDLGRTGTHEIGHWLNLEHIWGDDQDETDVCSGTDDVADTPNQDIFNFGCPTHPHPSCGSDDMFMNFMDYVDDDCMIMFSNGQSDRMDAVLYTTRNSIVSSQGDLPPSVTQDLYSRDMMDDVGDEPNTTSSYMYKSDDIWIRHSNDGITNQEHQNPIGGSTNYVYVRVRNRGCGPASNGNVKLYWAKASSGLNWPAPWDGSVTMPALMGDFIGQKPTGSVAASDFVILEFAWTAPNPADYSSFGADKVHFCLLSRIETSSTAPFGMTFPETSNLGDNVRNNNNIVWKNITVSEPSSAGGRFASTLVSNYTKNPAKFNIVFEVTKKEMSVFDHGRVVAILNDRLLELWREGGMKGKYIESGEKNEIILLNSGATLQNISLKPMQSGVIDVRFEPDQKQLIYNRNIFKLEMLQYKTEGNEFLGGQTFTFRFGN